MIVLVFFNMTIYHLGKVTCSAQFFTEKYVLADNLSIRGHKRSYKKNGHAFHTRVNWAQATCLGPASTPDWKVCRMRGVSLLHPNFLHIFVSLSSSSIVSFCCFTKSLRLEPRLKFKVHGEEIGHTRQTFQVCSKSYLAKLVVYPSWLVFSWSSGVRNTVMFTHTFVLISDRVSS